MSFITHTILPVLIKPRILSIKNRWRGNFKLKKQFGRDCVLLLFSVAIMLGIHNGIYSLLYSIEQSSGIAYFPLSLPLSVMLLLLFGMLLFANAVSALGTFFLSKDLELILASPVGTPRFFTGRFIELLTHSSWMIVLFGLPALIALIQFYDPSLLSILTSILILAPFFIIPAALAVVVITLLASFVPANRTREIMILLFALFLGGFYYFYKTIAGVPAAHGAKGHLFEMIEMFSIPHSPWIPSYWAAVSLSEVLIPSGRAIYPFVLLLLFTTSALVALAYLNLRLLHGFAYSKAISSGSGMRFRSREAQARILKLLPFLPPAHRALFVKEFRLFARDMTQAIQLALLLGICMIYLYNFRTLQSVERLPDATALWWRAFLIISNLVMGSFVITAVSTRFAYPSLSLEGRSFWIVHNAPISTEGMLTAKFRFWYPPVAGIATVIFASGGLAVQADPQIILMSALFGFAICYGVVGLAIGLGALFVNFDWDHSSQLTTGFGSLVFMLSATFLILLSLIPISLLVSVNTLQELGYKLSTWQWYTCSGISFLLVGYLNLWAKRWGFKLGQAALYEKREY